MKTKTYTEDEIEKRVRDHLDTYTVHEMVEYIVEDLFRYYHDHADPEDLQSFMEDDINRKEADDGEV